MSCGRAQEFLARKKVETKTMVNARDQHLGEKDALALAKQVDEIYAAKGQKVVHLDMRRDKPDNATLKALLVGPTGRLRAPTLRVGRKLLVGFNEEAYKKVLAR